VLGIIRPHCKVGGLVIVTHVLMRWTINGTIMHIVLVVALLEDFVKHIQESALMDTSLTGYHNISKSGLIPPRMLVREPARISGYSSSGFILLLSWDFVLFTSHCVG
jgi:hypothetical protein